MTERVGCVVDTAFEHDAELIVMHRLFTDVLRDAGVEVIGDRSLMPSPEYPTVEAEEERKRLHTIAESAGMMALWLHGQPPRSRLAVAAGFAAARGIPIFGLRTESQASTGENGIPFNLMLNAATAYSRNESFGHDSEIAIAANLRELRLDISSFLSAGAPRRPLPKAERGTKAYVANPYGFASSTKGFYYKELLPIVQNHIDFIDPWDKALISDGITAALTASPEKQAAAWTVLGIGHLERIRTARMLIACLDGEPSDVGTLVELGAAAGFGKPIIIYRNDFRAITEGPSAFDASIQAAANLWLPPGAAIARHDKFAKELDTFDQMLEEAVAA